MGKPSRRECHRYGGIEGEGGARQSQRLHHTILYRHEDFVAHTKEITGGEMCSVVYGGVGKTTFPASLSCLAPLGLFVSFGSASGQIDAFNINILQQKGSLFATRPTLNPRGPTRQAAATSPTICSRWWRAARSKFRSTRNIRCAMQQKHAATSKAAAPPAPHVIPLKVVANVNETIAAVNRWGYWAAAAWSSRRFSRGQFAALATIVLWR